MMNVIKQESIKLDGLDVRYYSAGQGEPLLVIHGAPATQKPGGKTSPNWR